MRRVAGLAVVVALAASTGCHRRSVRGAPTGPRPKLEVALVDDSFDALSGVDESTLPPGSRLVVENAPSGPSINVMVHYARIVAGPGETADDAAARLDTSLRKITIPPDHHFALGPVYDEGIPRPVAARSYLLSGTPILREFDVTAADAILGEDGRWMVAVTLSAAAAKRFEDATRLALRRRLAIVVDGRVNSAPVIQSVIAGGHIQITLGNLDPETQRQEAQRLAQGLGGT